MAERDYYSREAADDAYSCSVFHSEEKDDEEKDDDSGTTKSPKPKFDAFPGKHFDRPDDLTPEMINALSGVAGVSDFGIAIQCDPRPLVINCSPDYKEKSNEALCQFQKTYLVRMVIIWQEMLIIGAVGIDQKAKMTKQNLFEPPIEGGGCALGLPVTVNSLPNTTLEEIHDERALLGMYHCLAAQVEVGNDDSLLQLEIDLPGDVHFVASHGADTMYPIGKKARGVVSEYDPNAPSKVTGEVSVTLIADSKLEVTAPPPSLGLLSAPVAMADMNDIWDLGAVWKNGPRTNETNGVVVYVRHFFRSRTKHMRTIELTDAVVAKNQTKGLYFAMEGDSGSVVYSRNKDGTHKLLGAVSSVIQDPKEDEEAAGRVDDREQWVWVYENKRDHGLVKTDTASTQADGDLVRTRGITYILPYVNQIEVARRELQLVIKL